MIDPRPRLVAAARQFYQQGWMVGTAGNLSARLADDSFWITASGKHKGQLTERDFVRVSLDNRVLECPEPSNRPSAETSIHGAIYASFPEANACYHVHSVEANLMAHLGDGNALPLPPLEMLKGLGVWDDEPQVTMPIFKNWSDVPRIAREIEERFSLVPPDVPALLIDYHGVTVWGASLEAAQMYVEIVEYIFRYLVGVRQIKRIADERG